MTPKLISSFLSVLMIALTYNASANEITRTANNPQVAPTSIVKTIFREEKFMGDYLEEVPYTVEESYREKVPYREYESYTEQEDYYTSERVCRPTTDWEERCNGFGKDRQCSRVPVRGERCDTMMVRKSRPVTKHRWVTKEREEIRYRKVTKHRTESRCCKEQTRLVPERDFTSEVEFNFPAQASLAGNDVEKFAVSIEGDETTASVKITPTAAIYSYDPQVTKVGHFKFVVNMVLKPTYVPGDLADGTISLMQITALGKTVSLNFVDMGNVRKVKTTYDLTVIDANGTELVRMQKVVEDVSEIQWPLPVSIKDGAQVKVVLKAHRNGVVLLGPVDFKLEQDFKVQVEEVYDVKDYIDEGKVGKFSLSGEGASLVIYFRDQTKNIASVKTSYTFRIGFTGAGAERTKTFSRDQLKVMADGRIALGLAKDMGFTRAELADVNWASGIYIRNEVTRNANKIPKGSFSFVKNVTLWLSGY